MKKHGNAIPIPPTSPNPSAEALKLAEEAIGKLLAAIKPLSESVYNDNGDMTISRPNIQSDHCVAAYFAGKTGNTGLAAIRKITGGATDGDIKKFPAKFIRRRIVTGKEIWESSEPCDEMVWEACPYLRKELSCMGCPRWEEDEIHGKFQRGCFGLASEACRVVLIMQRKITGGTK